MLYNSLLKEMKLTKTGDHMVLLYDDKDVLTNVDAIASYITSRIIRNEKCFYISGDMNEEMILNKLKSSIELEKVIEKGQLSILQKSDAYSKEGKFNPNKMIKLLKKLAIEAVEEGYSGFAITGEISWVLEYEDGFQRIMDYEYMLNDEIFGNYPVSAICRYNKNKFSSKMIKNIIEVHPIIIYKGKIHENPFYTEIADTEKIDIEKYQVESMLNNINDFSHTKSRFHFEIEKKEKEYQELQLNLLENIIITVTSLLEIHDEYTNNHSQNVANIAKSIAEAMNLSQEKINQTYYSGLVHDIGKTLIPREIINKKGRLTEDEFKIIKEHPMYAYKALLTSKELDHIAKVVVQHHERIDGKGYPLGLKGDDILVESRILSIADAYDAMTSNRPYRKALTREEAFAEIRNNFGKQFDSDIANIAIEEVL
ncbi:MAG: MEDS domain-containing protein [Eubacteriales bacterium]